jgi:hypothetical protein
MSQPQKRKRPKAPPRIIFDAPPQLIDQVKARALRERMTLRLYMLTLLKREGFDVPENELVIDRRMLNAGRRPNAA